MLSVLKLPIKFTVIRVYRSKRIARWPRWVSERSKSIHLQTYLRRPHSPRLAAPI